jgi:hypothetical protein
MTTLPKKPRSDAWDASLTDAQRWQAYDRFRGAPWYQVSAWIAEEFKLAAPSRGALYRWASHMRTLEGAHRIEQSIQARAEISALASTAAADAALTNAYKAMAADLALKGNAADAVRYTAMAMAIGEAQRKAAETDLKARAQTTRDQALRLAREKFEAAEARMAAVRDAVGKARASGGLTPETLKKIEEAAGLL